LNAAGTKQEIYAILGEDEKVILGGWGNEPEISDTKKTRP